MEKKYSYKNLTAYKESKTLVIAVYKLLKKFPREETYALCDQLRRAVISVPSNLAEGSGRTSAKDQAHFFEMAYGSLMEVSCQIDIAHDLGYVTQEDVDVVDNHIGMIAALLSGLRSKRMNELESERVSDTSKSLNTKSLNNHPSNSLIH